MLIRGNRITTRTELYITGDAEEQQVKFTFLSKTQEELVTMVTASSLLLIKLYHYKRNITFVFLKECDISVV